MTKDWRCCDPAHCPGSTCVRSRRERKAARILKTDTPWPLPPDSRDGDVRVICSKCRKRRGGSVGAERPAVPPNPPPVDHAADAGAAASLPAATATVPAIAAAASVTAPVTVTPLAYQVAVDIPCLTRDTGLFVTDARVLRSLYSHSADDAHPGLTFWMLLPPDFPLTAAVPIRPPHFALLATRTDQAFHMPVVPFDLPARDCTELGLVGTQLYTPKKRKRGEVDTIERAGVLELVRVPHASRRQSQSNVVWTVYHKDTEEFTAWQTAEWFELTEAEQIACAIRSPFNPHRFAFDPANLCVLVPEISFPGFSAPSWYVKMLGSFFCLHVEQLFAPFYNICYEGSTTWWVVRTEDRGKLEKYIVTRARQWYEVPVGVQLSKVEEDALAGLLYTKHVVFHPSDLVAAGIRVTKVVQLAGTVVVGLGDAVHFGMCSVPADHVRQGRSAETGRSVNEAVNFIPVQWLGDGLLRYAEWMQWLQRSWITMQRDGSMRQAGLQHMRAAVVHKLTNYLVAKHCSCHWSHMFFKRLRALLVGPAAATPTRRAIDEWLNGDAQRLTRAVQCVDTVLTIMADSAVKEWLLLNTPVTVNKKEVLLPDYEDVDVCRW